MTIHFDKNHLSKRFYFWTCSFEPPKRLLAIQTKLSRQHTFFFTALTLLIKDWVCWTKSKTSTNFFFEKKDSLITQTLLFGDLKCFLTVNKSISQTIIRLMWCLQKWHNEPFLMISWMISSAPEEVHPEMVILFCKTHYPIRRYSAPLLSAHCRSTNHLLLPHVSQITFFFRFNIPWYFFPSC